VLAAALGGVLVGGLVGAPLPWPGLPGLPGVPGLSRVSDSGRQIRRNVAAYGGNDINGARENALKVWARTPSTMKAGLQASYQELGASSTEQIGNVRNVLAAGASDLIVIDPQYLPELVAKKQLRRFDSVSTDSLADLGCFPGLVRQCTVDGPLYALPLNADAPMLVINRALLGTEARERAGVLATVVDPRAFWSEASAIAEIDNAATARTVLLQTGDYEGMTVCLVELICAFGGDVASDPALRTTRNQDALADLRKAIPSRTFELPANGKGDEDATVAALQQNTVAVARLWPAQCHGLTAGPPADETKASDFLIIPVPGGVLGGQVTALTAESSNSGAAEEAARFLAQPLSQLQLFTAAGYVPTLAPVHVVTSVQDELRDLGAQLDRAKLRPSLRAYTTWSTQFSLAVRNYLLGLTQDIAAEVSQPLSRFASPDA
jgi:ABC-type glycerol-3-phosphate transport system substrate-binding protein